MTKSSFFTLNKIIYRLLLAAFGVLVLVVAAPAARAENACGTGGSHLSGVRATFIAIPGAGGPARVLDGSSGVWLSMETEGGNFRRVDPSLPEKSWPAQKAIGIPIENWSMCDGQTYSFPYSWGAALGRNNRYQDPYQLYGSTVGGATYGWVYDCETSTTGTPQWVSAWAAGTPAGYRAGGYWSYNDPNGTNGTYSGPLPNDIDVDIVFYYHEPPPPGYGATVFIPKLTDPMYSHNTGYYNDECLVGGWAVDSTAPKAKLQVDVYWDYPAGDPHGTSPNTVSATQFWPGVHDELWNPPDPQGIDSGPDDSVADTGHGFFTRVPSAYRTGGTHTAYVYAHRTGGSAYELNYSPGRPLTFSCSPPTSSYFYPWFQTGNADVNAWGKIVGQTFGSTANGQRPNRASATDPVEATYLVMAALQRGQEGDPNATTGLFCSTNGYILGSSDPNNCGAFKRYKFDLTESYVAGNTSGSPLGYVMQNPGSSVSDLINGNHGEQADMMNIKLGAWQTQVKDCVTPTPDDKKPHWIREIDIKNAVNTIDSGGFVTTGSFAGSSQAFRPSLFDGNSVNFVPPTGLQSNGRECTSSVLAATSGGSGQFNFDLGGLTFKRGGRVTYWIKPTGSAPTLGGRDVYIKSNINTDLNSTSTYAQPQNAPQIAIVASGNIYIDPDVTNIDASLYSTGKIFTCYRPASSSGNATDAGNYYKSNGPACKNKLTIRGSVMARSGLQLGRTSFTNPGTFTSSSEQIYMTGQALAFPPLGWNKDNLTNKESINVRYLDSSEGPRF